MCAIAGLFDFAGTGTTPARHALLAMIATMRHRGPDGVGLYASGPVGLAHARLAIIDPDGGAQPIHNEDRSIEVVFNGEIFNYLELRRELELAGHHFYTQSDTEVLVHLYEAHGDDFVTRLNGQFALALWDAKRQRLVLARDRTGIRPLFYARAGGMLAFASEIKALFALPEVKRRLDRRALGQVFTFWAPLAPATAFEGVFALPPGHHMVVCAGRTQVTRYWDWSFPSAQPSAYRRAEECAEELRALLDDAVRLQLRADVPVGAYLSGGLDSSVVSALARRYAGTALATFSLTFEDVEFDESAHQRELVARLGTRHTALACTKADIAAAFPRMVLHAETPVLRTAPVPLMLLAERVRAAGYKVVLTGEGADEVFGGYDIFKEARIRRCWAHAPGSKARPRLLERLYPYLVHSPVAGRGFTAGFFGAGLDAPDAPWFAHLPRWTTTQRAWQFFAPEQRAALAGWDARRAIADYVPAAWHTWSPLARDQYVEAHTLMSGYLLAAQGDRVAMAHSIEGRFPFLDHRVIEFANRLPAEFKLMGLQEKYLLKQAMDGLLPDSVRLRTKQPYRAPDSASFFAGGRLVDYAADALSPGRLAQAGIFDADAVAKLIAKCQAGRVIGFADNMAFVGILSTMLLHQAYVAAPAPRLAAGAATDAVPA